MTRKGGAYITNSRQGLVCARWDGREATKLPADFAGKSEDESDEQFDARVRGAVRCAIHAAGAARRKWGDRPTTYADLPDDLREAALRSMRRAEERDRQATRQKDQEHHERMKAVARHAWRELDEEPDYVVRHTQETSLLRPGVEHRWMAYEPGPLARWEAGETEWASPVLQVRIDDRDQFEDITTPAELQISNASRITPKLSAVLAGMIAEASELVATMNVERRARFEEQAATWEGNE